MAVKRSKVGAGMSFGPPEWSQGHRPATNVIATSTRAAGGPGVKHVLTSFEAILAGLDAAVEAVVNVNIRDGASGAGTILRSFPILVTPGGMAGLSKDNLNIYGSENTAMTIEFDAAGGASTYESVGMSGYDVVQG